MTDDNGDSHQHHRSGDAAQDEADKSQTRTIRHDALVSFLPDKTREPGKRFNPAGINLSASQPSGMTQERERDASRCSPAATARPAPKPRYNMA